jgi:predicted RNase H-like nuclease
VVSVSAGEPVGPRAVGIDAAGKFGWVGVLVDESGFIDAQVGSLDELIRWAEPVAAIGVDIPIGSVPGGVRDADARAREFVGPRRSSVFPAVPGDVLDAVSYAEANHRLERSGRAKLSRQAWMLAPGIREASTLAARDERVIEVHPEVSFRELAGEPIRWSKKTWNGMGLRRRLLAGAGIEVPGVIESLDRVPTDDVLDAAVSAWSALRYASRTAVSLPDPPQLVDGRPVAIWF